MKNYHEPVLTREVVELLHVVRGKRYIDATAGGGGHSNAILAAGGKVLAVDRDSDAVQELTRRFNGSNSIAIVHGNFRDLEKIAKEFEFTSPEGILFDLGVSSHQLDTLERGFSYRERSAPLDMRMSQNDNLTAATILNEGTEKELYEIFVRFGEEELAGPISRAIVGSRAVNPFSTVGQVIDGIESVVKDASRRQKVVARIFQAIRIAVNSEIEALDEGLVAAKRILTTGGRFAVISFHSLEDRRVKRFFAGQEWKVVTKKPVIPSYEEQIQNPRSKSAKLRVAIKL